MKKQLSFITCILLTLILSASAFGGQSLDAEAAAKVKYSYTKIDDSRVLPGGRFDNYFKYPKLKGSSKAVQRINNQLKKQGQSFVKIEAGYSMAEIEETIRNDYENRHTYCEYFNTVDGKAAYNDGDIFSIQFKSAWFLGGVSNYNTYGATFDVETGKKLNLMDVVSDDFSDFSDLQRVIYYRLESQYGSEVAQAFDEKYSTEKALKKVNFYVNEKGKVIVCFQTYELSYGAAGCLTVTLPSRF